MLESSHFFQPVNMKDKIEKLTINIALICENNNYCESNFFYLNWQLLWIGGSIR